MFNGAPTVLNVSGTPEVAEKKSSYSNWSSTDKETILWDALEVLRTIIYRVPGVTDVRTLCNSDDLDQWCRDGFEPCPVNLQINGYWVEDDYNYSTYVYPYEDSITILMGTTGLMDAFQWTYSWDGECISGYDIEEYGTIEEFIEIEGLVK